MSFNFKRFFGLAMVGLMVAFAPLLAGCGGAASTSGSSSGGSSGGSSGEISVSGTVEILQKHLSQLGINGISLQSLSAQEANMKVHSLKPFASKVDSFT